MLSSTASDQNVMIALPRTSESETLKRIRHTTSHVLAMAVEKLFSKAQVTIAPWFETGFYPAGESTEICRSLKHKTIKTNPKLPAKNLPLVLKRATYPEF